MLWAEADEAVDDARTKPVAELRAAYARALESEGIWGPIRGDERFSRIVARTLRGVGGK